MVTGFPRDFDDIEFTYANQEVNITEIIEEEEEVIEVQVETTA